MPLAPESRDTNLEKSLVAWIQAQLVAGAGLAVFYDQSPPADRPSAWVHVDFMLGMRRDFGRQISGTQLGSQVHGLVQLSLCKQRVTLTNLYGMAAFKDTAIAAFQIAQDIPLRNYDVGGLPVIGVITVEDITENDTDDGYESGVIVKVLSVGITYVEAYTLV